MSHAPGPRSGMNLDFFGLTLDPFDPEPDPRFLVLTPLHREALATLVYALDQREGWALLHGGAGLGKTTLLRGLMLQLDQSVTTAVVSRPLTEALPFFNQIALSLGLEGPYTSKGPFLRDFRAHLEQLRERERALLLAVDDAQMLPPELLTEIRLLGNEDMAEPRVLNLFLSARPFIHAQMERGQEWELHQLLHRQARLTTLDQEQAAQYLGQRLEIAGGDPALFQPEALRLIHLAGHGVPRTLNSLCRLCLEQAEANGLKSIGPDTVRLVLDGVPLPVSTPGQGWVSPDEAAPPPAPLPLQHGNFPPPGQALGRLRPSPAPARNRPGGAEAGRPAHEPLPQPVPEHELVGQDHRLHRGVGQPAPHAPGHPGAFLPLLLPPLGG